MNSKILFFLHLPPPVHGSSMVGNFVYQSRLINDKFVCRYINILASEEVSESGKISVRKILDFAKIFWKLIKELTRKKPDACYLALTVKGAAFYRDVILVTLLKIFKIKRIYHLHNKGVAIKQKYFFYRFFYRMVFNNADVILLSEHLYSDVHSFVPENRIYICPNGIPDIKNFSKQTKGKPTQVKMLFLSNLIESKGIFVLLEACSILKKKGLAFACDFIGGEGDVSTMQFKDKVNKLDLNDRVNYLGKKHGVEKEKLYAKSDIFVFPTYNETFGLVVLEAMQNALPVVATFEGALPEIVSDGTTGYIVPKKNIEALADRLGLLIKDSLLRKKMGLAGRKKYEELFTLEKFETRLTEILNKLT